MTVKIKTSKAGHKTFWRDGKRLPSPSGICSRFKDSGGLIYWANQEGLAGRTLEEARNAAVTPGSIVHEMIEMDVRGKEFDRGHWNAKIVVDKLDPDVIWGKVESSWGAYQDWRAMTNMKVIAAEVSLASEKHDFGGTLDAVAVSGQTHLLDWKTGGLYPDHLVQIAGYAVLWEENMPDQPLDGCALLSVSKEHGGFTHASYGRNTIQVAIDQFLALRECYERDKALKKMV